MEVSPSRGLESAMLMMLLPYIGSILQSLRDFIGMLMHN
jgi:hypothetical protein